MNQTTNSSLPSPWDPYIEQYILATIQGGWITLGCSILQIGLLLVTVTKEHQCTIDQKSFLTRFFSTINFLILFLILSNCISVLFLMPMSPALEMACMVAGNFFGYSFQFLVVYYTWFRSYAVLSAIAEWSVVYLRPLVVLYSLLQIILFCLVIVDTFFDPEIYYTVVPYVQTTSQVLVFLFEVIVLIVFVQYLRTWKHEGFGTLKTQNSKKLIIISRAGIASFWTYQVYLATSIGFNYVNSPSLPIVSVPVLILFWDVQQYAPLVYIFIQLGMKWAIISEREKVVQGSGLDRTPVPDLTTQRKSEIPKKLT
ncbi:hypothetical protein BC830DRAFT_1186291 [Chytriomyces sp. MP71]|nr:hypothetical protein BC830DRAFT_1186291 [Chytriomyces sp. MP71]